ncbi:MAG: AsnC family transcriptional regulator, partial [Psychrobacillus psychrotolerans]
MYGKHQLDHLDKKIIILLSKDGRRPFTELAEELKVTEKTIRTRYKNLTENEILNVTGVVNPVAIGIKAGAIILVKVQLSQLEQVIEEVRNVKEVRFISLISGSYQL